VARVRRDTRWRQRCARPEGAARREHSRRVPPIEARGQPSANLSRSPVDYGFVPSKPNVEAIKRSQFRKIIGYRDL